MEEPQSTSAVIYIEQKNLTTVWKLQKNAKFIEVKLYAIKQGLKYIELNKLINTAIFTDSLPSILILQNRKL